jgi:simple sugar transport system permease protein
MQIIKKIKLSDDLRSSAARYLAALICVIVVGVVLIAAQGADVTKAFATILKGAFGSKTGFGSTLRYVMPCMMLGIAAAVAFKTGVYNMGIEGQMYFGSLVAALVGYQISLPAGIHALVCILAGGIAGVLWGLIPALAKMIFNVSEMIVTMMMNYVALLLTEYIVQWVILGGMNVAGTVVLETKSVLSTARLPVLIKGTTASTGLFIAFAITIAVYILFKYTFLGYELKQVGENIKFSRVGGINVSRIFLLIFIISSFISGVVGSVEIIGPYKRFAARYASNLPWEGIMIAFISKHKPLAIIVVSCIWGALRAGALSLERTMAINKMTIYILQMLFVLFVSVDFDIIGRKLSGLITVLKKQAGEERKINVVN